tara:strand:- start:861 stop:1187 length:327 start_codon:yes stop_codon:yes gene_type:complete
MPIFRNNRTGINKNPLYDELLEKRGLPKIEHFRTMPFSGLDTDTIMVSEYIWRAGDSLQKLSRTFYRTYEYWWVIGFVNKKPTDAHYKLGDTVYIPTDPSYIADNIGS